MQKLFEKWFMQQFSQHSNALLEVATIDGEDRYKDDEINALWIGFNAGYELSRSGL